MIMHFENTLIQLPQYLLGSFALVVIIWLIQKFIFRKRQNGIHYFWLFCFFVYLLLLYEIVIGIESLSAFYSTRHRPNFLPFIDIIKVYDMGLERMMTQVFLNIILMIPFGFLLPVTFTRFRSFGKTGLTILGVSAVIEIVQYFIGRSADIDDVIMNFVGGIAGYFCFKLYEKCRILIMRAVHGD